jgi:hypothetical protein
VFLLLSVDKRVAERFLFMFCFVFWSGLWCFTGYWRRVRQDIMFCQVRISVVVVRKWRM